MQEIIPFFTPIFIEILNYNSKNDVNFIMNIQKNSKNVQMSNIGGWQSKHYNENSNDSLLPLFDIIKKRMQEIYTKYGINKKVEIGNYWFNVNKKNNFNRSHQHSLSKFSGVFYFKTPKNCGNIFFERPDDLLLTCEVDNNTEYSFGDWNIEPKENMLIIFPSFLRHWVEPNQNDEERISLAINFI
jgi:uncharacterized protein (TIGR02466 family)